jgi:5-methylcytosine-specific restriction endonuclease McrA
MKNLAQKDPAKLRKYREKYKQANPEKYAASIAKHRAEKRDRIRQRCSEWKKQNKALSTAINVSCRNKRLDHYREMERKRRQNKPEVSIAAQRRHYAKASQNPIYRLSAAIRAGVTSSLSSGKNRRRTFDLLGYSVAELRQHLERQFQSGMNWENYGLWHVDHIIPLSAHNFRTADDFDFKRAWALSNLRPLWARENQIKGKRLSRPFQPSLL